MIREKDFPRRAIFAGLACLAVLASACTSLETRITRPGNRALLDAGTLGQMESALGIERRSFQVPDGPELFYRVVEPMDYGAEYRFTRTGDSVHFRFNLANPPDQRTPVDPVGTAVLLHGWSMEGSSMLPWALGLAGHGWRAVVVDLRAHGGSSHAPVGYGPREGADVAALAAALRERGEVPGRLVLFGVSYGAVAGLYAAALSDTGTSDAVIAMSPFTNAASGIRGMINGITTQPGLSLRSRLALAYARRRYDDARIDHAIAGAGERLGIDLAGIDVRQAAAAVEACTLLLHGTEDGFFPMESVQSLADAAPRGQLVALPGESHFTAPMRMDWLVEPLARWLEQVADARCPGFNLPPVPQA